MQCRALCKLKGPAFLLFSVKQPCKDSICCYLVSGGALPTQERDWVKEHF